MACSIWDRQVGDVPMNRMLDMAAPYLLTAPRSPCNNLMTFEDPHHECAGPGPMLSPACPRRRSHRGFGQAAGHAFHLSLWIATSARLAMREPSVSRVMDVWLRADKSRWGDPMPP